MKAVVIDESTPTRSLRIQTVPEPVPGPSDLHVAVKAAGVNRADLRRVAVHFAASTEKGLPIAGLEFAGEVLAIGDSLKGEIAPPTIEQAYRTQVPASAAKFMPPRAPAGDRSKPRLFNAGGSAELSPRCNTCGSK